MPVLEITEDQIISLLRGMPTAKREHLFAAASVPDNAMQEAEEPESPASKPRPVFGSGKKAILFIADDFDAPLDDFKEYMG